jgi:uncharacterized membrane protein YczE
VGGPLTLPRRALLLLAGSFVSTLCYAVTIRAGLGLGPLYAVQQGVARQAGTSIGHGVMIVGCILLVLALALRGPLGAGTIVLPFLGGTLLDLLLPSIPAVSGVALRLGADLAASWVMALGGALVIRASVGIASLDAIMLALHRLLRSPVVLVRGGMEFIMLVTGWVIGGSIGVGTVITGLVIGPALQLWLRLLSVSAPAVTPAEG